MLSVINIISYTYVIITVFWGILIICFMCQSIRHFAFLVKKVFQKGCLWLRSTRDCLVCQHRAPVPEAGPMLMPVVPLLLQSVWFWHLWDGLVGRVFRWEVGGAVCYHWRELPQVSFLLWQNTSFVMTKVCLPWENFCLSQNVCHKYLSRQTRVSHDKGFVMTSILLSWQKTCFVATNVFVTTKASLSQQRLCHDKIMFVVTKVL